MAVQNIFSANRIAAAGGGFEPQRVRNFIFSVTLGVGGQDLIQLCIEKAFLPSETTEEIEIWYGNEVRKVAGPTKFEDGTLSIKDFVDQAAYAQCVAWRRQVYNADDGSIGMAAVYKKEASITLYAPNGTTARVIKLIGCWPKALKANDLDYTANEKVLVEMTLAYDKADYVFAKTA